MLSLEMSVRQLLKLVYFVTWILVETTELHI